VETESCWAEINGVRLDLRAGELLFIRGGDEFCFGHDPARPHWSLSVALALEQGSEANTLRRSVFERRYVLADPARYAAEFEIRVHFGQNPADPHKAVVAFLAGAPCLIARRPD
jgi:hypothetical protein